MQQVDSIREKAKNPETNPYKRQILKRNLKTIKKENNQPKLLWKMDI